MRVCRALSATALIALAVAFAPAHPAVAESAGFHLDHQTIVMAIQKNGAIDVTETLDVDYASEPHHGIFRNFQVRFDYNPNPKYERVYKLSNIHVSATGASAHNSISDTGREKIFKIGDAKHTVTGEHQYTINYVLHGALNAFPDHDELYWNVVGFGWEIPIDSTEIHVTAPGGITKIACYEGPDQSTLPCDTAQVQSPQAAAFAQGVLYPGQGMSVVVAIDKGVVDRAGVKPILDEKWAVQRAFAVTPGTAFGSLGLLIALVGLVVRMIWKTGRDRQLSATGNDERRSMFDHHGGPVQYRPPENARPAQVGVLIDERADPLDVTATIVDLGVRGYLTLEETEKTGLFHKADWKLTKVKDEDGELMAYERRLFTGLFEGRAEVLLSELKNTFASDLHAVQNSLYADCVATGWFARRPDRVRSKYLALGIVALVLAVGVLVLLAAVSHAALLGIPLVLAAIVLAAGHRWMPARTGKGSAALDQAMGFKQYMATAEADRMKFAEEESVFAKYLPFAIIFHETERWAKAFQGIYGDNPPPGMGWYTPYGSWNNFGFGGFAHSMSSFAVQTSGTIVSTPGSSGSSGFGGGGFSGGGGGGGGGGGW